MVNKSEIRVSDIENEMTTAMEANVEIEPKLREVDEHRLIRIEDIKPLKEQVEGFQRKIISRTLTQFPSIRKAAEALHIYSSSFVRKMQKYRIQKEIMYREM